MSYSGPYFRWESWVGNSSNSISYRALVSVVTIPACLLVELVWMAVEQIPFVVELDEVELHRRGRLGDRRRPFVDEDAGDQRAPARRVRHRAPELDRHRPRRLRPEVDADQVGPQLAGTPANLSLVLGAIRQSLFLGLLLLIFVVLIRLLSKRLWVADVAGALVFSVLGVSIIGPIAGPIMLFVACLSWLWLLQRLGLLPFLIAFSLFVTRFMPMVLDGWLVTRSIALHAIPVLIAAAALGAVLAAQPKMPAPQATAAT